MWDIRSIMLFICSILVVIIISMKMAHANPVLNWFESEKQKTIEYQTKAWTKTKDQFVRTKESILKLFKKKDESHD